MKITSITRQQKDRNRLNIFLDGEFCFGLYENSVLKFGLRNGDELEQSEIDKIKEFDELEYGKKTAYTFLAYRQRSKKELSRKLQQKKISEKTIKKVLEILEKQKYIDDEKFAKNFLEDKLKSKPAGRRLLKLKLSEKGISREILQKTIDENYSDEKEFEAASLLLKKYKTGIKKADSNEMKSKCYRYLISRGFDFEIVKKLLSID